MPFRILPLITFLFLLAQSAFAQNAEIPFSGGRPQVEYKQTGNTYQWKPVTGKMPSQGVVYGSSHGVSNAEPKINTQGKLPYSTKPGASTGPLKVSSKISPQKFGKVAGNILKGAAVGADGLSGGVVPLSMLACAFYCEDLISLLGDQIDGFRVGDDGDIEFVVKNDDTDFFSSDGYYYCHWPSSAISSQGCGIRFYSYSEALESMYQLCLATIGTTHSACKVENNVLKNYRSNYWYGASPARGSFSDCPAGQRIQISTGKCFEPSDDRYTVKSWQELDRLFGGYAENINLWNGSRAPHLAANLAPKYDILDDTQPVSVTGPSSAPISETVTRESVNLSPGTNTPVSPGHTGPTDSGTRTTTKTTTAQNTYSGDTMTTTTVTNTTTNITNNITNNTTNVGTSTEETDKAPEKEKPTCEENPDSLECAELDTPDGEIPRDEIQITFQPDDLGLGGGSCPGDHSLGGEYVFSYAATCDMLSSYGRYLVWILASMSALLIIFAGRSEA